MDTPAPKELSRWGALFERGCPEGGGFVQPTPTSITTQASQRFDPLRAVWSGFLPTPRTLSALPGGLLSSYGSFLRTAK
eukprot:6308814-Alexandrium_andersonii.AAC.1